MILSLCLTGALAVPAMALTTSTAEVENAAPIAEDLILKTYKGVAISSRFAAVDPEGDLVTFQVVDSPARGAVAVDETDPAAFTYTPYEGKKGKDTFTYVAVDANGNTSKPATVKVNIQKQTTTVSYSDMSGDPAHFAAGVRGLHRTQGRRPVLLRSGQHLQPGGIPDHGHDRRRKSAAGGRDAHWVL